MTRPGPAGLAETLDAMLDGFATFLAVREDGAVVDFEFGFVNAAGAETYGIPPEAIVGRRLRAMAPRAETSGIFDAYVRLVETGERLEMTQFSSGDETGRSYDLRAWRVDDGFAVTWRDVTERERTISALRAGEQRFRTSVELLHEALSVFVAVRGADGRIADFRWTYANAAASAITGYAPDELAGRTLLDVLPDHGPSGMLDVYRRVVETGEPYVEPSLWYEDVWGDGQLSRRAFDVRASRLGDGFVVVTREVTEERERAAALAEQRAELERAYAEMLRVGEEAHRAAEAERQRLETQLHQSQRLESLGQLAGGVAHDFNNLLAAILNYSSFVAEEVDAAAGQPGGERWAAVHDDVGQIRRAAERATTLTRQLLAFGRREVVRPQVLNLNDVVREVEALLRRSIGEHVVLVTDLAGDLSATSADSGQVEQVLLNLAVNARDAMPGGGTLTISTANVAGTVPMVCLRVADTGTGMDPDVRARAFEPFFTTKPRGAGSGLGLATVYGIVLQSGGRVTIESEPGRGCAFVVLLPVTADVPAVAEPVADTPPATGRETVLLVEDEDAMREVTRRMLARNGYDVVSVPGGGAALEAARERAGDIALLLTDVVMPDLPGTEVAERFGREWPGIRVLYMSGYAQPELASHGTLDAGVSLLEKPFSEQVLLTKVREALDAPRAPVAEPRVT